MQHCEFMFQGERLQVLQNGALYWPTEPLLAVADLHGQIRQNGENRQRPASPAARPARTECTATSAASADCRSDPAWWKTSASTSSGTTGRKRAPTPCSPPYAASKTCVGPTSSIGGLVAPQPPAQKWDAPGFLRLLCNEAKNMLAAKKIVISHSPDVLRRMERGC